MSPSQMPYDGFSASESGTAWPNWGGTEWASLDMAVGNSTEPCLAVVMETSSFLPTEASTVGQEALFMVLAFLEGELGSVYGGVV